MRAQNVVDLFAGVGGLSLGAARAGFLVSCAVELDPLASRMHALNFPNAGHLTEDISGLSGRRLLAQAGLKKGTLAGLIGGPPCQGFSCIGLRAANDPRNELLKEFFRLVAETRPAFFLAENVPGVLHERNADMLQRALHLVPKTYVVLKRLVVRASDYGAPTMRTRVFFYGYDPNKIGKLVIEDFAPPAGRDVRVKNALVSLPSIRASWQSEELSWRSVGKLGNSYFDRRIMDCIPPGVGDQGAIARYAKRRLTSGFLGTHHESSTVRRFAALAPGERDLVSKCRRLDREGYCPTLLAGTGFDRGRYQAIRPVHPSSPRVIAPREAARLQGFPDWFQFHHTKWHSFRQIGNSVSPVVAEALLTRVFKAIS